MPSLCVNFVFLAAAATLVCADDKGRERFRYLRAQGDGFATECKFVIARDKSGWSIVSTTDRGAIQMHVETRYDADDRPVSARVALTTHSVTKTATVQIKDGKATVRREGQPPAEFDAPKGTIITSAPDWTDVFLLCCRCDRQRKGKQEFPSLWIQPTPTALGLSFTIAREGGDAVEASGKKPELPRYAIRIRNNSGYTAWADSQGRLVRLIPL